jgi:hypothetical protein
VLLLLIDLTRPLFPIPKNTRVATTGKDNYQPVKNPSNR